MRWALLTLELILVMSALQLEGQWQQDVERLLTAKELSAALVTLQVKSLDGKVLFEKNPEVGVMPASTLKTITTLGAIGILGSDYQYSTTIGYRGELTQDRTLYGDLILKGSGDPSFGSDQDDRSISLAERMETMAEAIAGKVNCIDGKLIVDATIFDNEAVHPGWAWDDLSNYYAAGIWGLNIHENLYHLTFSRSAIPGSDTKVKNIEPSVSDLNIRNEVIVGPKGSYDEAYIYGDPYELKKHIRGTIPPGASDFKIKGAVPDSRIWFAQLLSEELSKHGIDITEIEVVDAPVDRFEAITSFNSMALRDLVQHANEVSDNLYCDVFLKSVGANFSGMGSWESGQDALKSYFQKSNISISGYHQEDGSGLTMRNRVSAQFMTDFMLYHVNKLGVDELKYLLPKAGVNGSVKNFLNGYQAQSHTWLKSGSINAVVAYTGIIEVSPDKYVVIYIASNGHTLSNRVIRKRLEKIIDTVYQGLSDTKKN